jgi:hypothetical protein
MRTKKKKSADNHAGFSSAYLVQGWCDGLVRVVRYLDRVQEAGGQRPAGAVTIVGRRGGGGG